jgi:peptide/nickel transport system ATP-binding protein
MIYQMADTALNPKIRVGDIIGRPAQFYSGLEGVQLKKRVHELLELIELDPVRFYNRFPMELSGGEKQRIGIARALSANPEFFQTRRRTQPQPPRPLFAGSLQHG